LIESEMVDGKVFTSFDSQNELWLRTVPIKDQDVRTTGVSQ